MNVFSFRWRFLVQSLEDLDTSLRTGVVRIRTEILIGEIVIVTL